jgi:hypothetical protein
LFQSYRDFEAIVLGALSRLKENRKLRLDITTTDAKYLIIFKEIIKKVIEDSQKTNRIELKLNKVAILNNSLAKAEV